MPFAEIHKKVPANIRRSEDALTGSAFNLLTLLPPDVALLPWLKRATNVDAATICLPHNANVHVAFWPRWKDGSNRDCEPDVVLTLESAGHCTVVLVELKYLSGVSGWPVGVDASGADGAEVRGQLGREWDALASVLCHELPGSPGTVHRRVLVYITPDVHRPTELLRMSLQEIANSNRKYGAGLFWVSWFDLGRVVREGLERSDLPNWQQLGLQRLFLLLTARRLVVFSGIQRPTPPTISWSYCPP